MFLRILTLSSVVFALQTFAQGWSGQVYLTHKERINDHVDNNSSGEIEAFARYTLESGHAFRLRLMTKIDYTNSENNFQDPRFYHLVKLYETEDKALSLHSDIRLGIGLSEASQHERGAISYLTWAPMIAYDMGKTENAAFSVYYKPYLTLNFYDEDYSDKIDVAANQLVRTPNIDQSIYHLFALDITIQEVVMFELAYAYTQQWNSLGDRVDDEYEFYQELWWTVHPQVNIVLGHSNAAALYNDDGVREPLSVTNSENNSELFYAKLNFKF